MSCTPSLVPNAHNLLDIESALQKIDEVASNQEGIAAEEALILRGYVSTHSTPSRTLKVSWSPSPQPDQLEAYTDALERLNANIAFGSAEENQRDTVRIQSRPSFCSCLTSSFPGEVG